MSDRHFTKTTHSITRHCTPWPAWVPVTLYPMGPVRYLLHPLHFTSSQKGRTPGTHHFQQFKNLQRGQSCSLIHQHSKTHRNKVALKQGSGASPNVLPSYKFLIFLKCEALDLGPTATLIQIKGAFKRYTGWLAGREGSLDPSHHPLSS